MRRSVVVAVALKVVLVALVLFALTHLDWERFADKAMTARAVLYPLAAAIVPLVWLAGGRRFDYPGVTDALLVAPFVVDLAGNALDLYDSVTWFDDACHLGNWAVLTLAVGLPIARRCGPWVTLGLCVGFGATTALVWEVGEYGAFILKTEESVTAYRDTIGDMTLGLTGATVAGLVAMRRASRT
ncbi:MAG TPA: hypothetical protein VNQ77_17015 [Frankiaceae bacterium]|nr:hypothetical protein [Frankiaceae bacterium]